MHEKPTRDFMWKVSCRTLGSLRFQPMDPAKVYLGRFLKRKCGTGDSNGGPMDLRSSLGVNPSYLGTTLTTFSALGSVLSLPTRQSRLYSDVECV